MTLNKMHGLGVIFTMLVVVLIVSPSTINNMYNNILGRVGLIALIIFFAMHNVTLGLLAALCVIVASNMSMVEGFDTASIGTGQNIDPSLLGTGQNISNIKAQLQAAQANQSATTSSSTTAPTTSTTSSTSPTTSTTSSTSPTTSTTAPPAPSTTATATPTTTSTTSSTTPSTNSSTTSSTPSTSSSTYTMPSFTTTLTKRINNGSTTGSTTTGATTTGATTTGSTTGTTTGTTTGSNTTGATTTGTNSSNGVDRQSVQQALQSTSSNSMPVNKGMFKSDEVAPSSKESFGCMGAPY
jgi:hypothetical protein